MTPLTGSWYNPTYDGEGWNFSGLFATYFTYDNSGYPTWYYSLLERTGDTLTGDLYQTIGGSLQGITNPTEIQHNKVGIVEFVFDDTWRFTATINGVSAGYDLYSLAGTEIIISPPDTDPAPEPEPDPEPPANPFEGKLTFRHRPYRGPVWLNGSFMQGTDGNWYASWGTSQLHWANLDEGRNTVYEMEITALETVNFTGGAHNYGNPSIDGLPATLQAGQTVQIRFRLDKAGRPIPAEQAYYQIDTQWGTLVLYTAHIMGGQT